MGKKAAVKPAQQVLNTNLVNKSGAAASSNALDKINFSSIKCHVCSRIRPVSCYSNRQVLKHRNTVYNPYIPGGRSFNDYATCKDCTAAQVDILHCFICNVDKPIDSFLKTQRSQAKPRCKACVQYCLDVERDGMAPNIDNYVDDSSDESTVDNDSGESANENSAPVGGASAEVEDTAEDSDDDVDAPKGEKAGAGTTTANVSKKMASMNLLDTSSSGGKTTPITKTRGTTPASRATPATADSTSDNDVNGSDGGAWETVKVAGKTNSAYRTPTTWASLLGSGMATPAAAGTAGFTTITRPTTATRTSVNSGFASPTASASYSSTGRKKWGKPAKLKAGEVVDDVWVTKEAEKNKWKPYGGQPKLVKIKKQAHNSESEGEGDDGEEC
ncbi:Stc1 domain-containing protein [Tirmania nivea]|nr:Stc1 domain-containing protein [Tirmania nivea]